MRPRSAKRTEEIGLPPDRVAVLGRLSDYETVTGYSVTPVSGGSSRRSL